MAEKRMKKTVPLKGQELLNSIEEGDMKQNIPEFGVGDTVDVAVRIQEGGKERTQVFQGVCIARKGRGSRETFTVRRIVQGEGVERIFPLHSPNIQRIEVLRKGKVSRDKLYYLRERRGKAAKVEEHVAETIKLKRGATDRKRGAIDAAK